MFPHSLWDCCESLTCLRCGHPTQADRGWLDCTGSECSVWSHLSCLHLCLYILLFVCVHVVPTVHPSHPRPLISGSPLAERAGSCDGEDQAEGKRGRVRKDGKRRRTDQRCRLCFPAGIRARPKHKHRVKPTPSQYIFK